MVLLGVLNTVFVKGLYVGAPTLTGTSSEVSILAMVSSHVKTKGGYGLTVVPAGADAAALSAAAFSVS